MQLEKDSVHYTSIVLSSEAASNITATTTYMQTLHGTRGTK